MDNQRERDEAIRHFFNAIVGNIPIRSLEHFVTKTAYGTEFELLCFRDEIDEWEEEYKMMAETDVIIYVYPPASEQDEYYIISYEEFYRNMEDVINRKVKVRDPGNPFYDEKLAELKKVLELK